MLTRKQTLIFFIVFAFVAIGIWLLAHRSHATKTIVPKRKDTPDAFMSDVKVTHTNKEGKIESTLSTRKVTHYSFSDKTEVDKPHFILYEENKEPWHIYADNGRVLHEEDTIELWGNVRIEKAKGRNPVHTKITTERLLYYPEKHIVETDKPIQLSQPGSKIKSVGMRAYIKEERIELLSKAKGEVE